MKRDSNPSFAVAFVSQFHAGVRGGTWKKAAPAAREATEDPAWKLPRVRDEDAEDGAAESSR